MIIWYLVWFLLAVVLIYFGIQQDSPLTIIVFVLILALLILIKQKPKEKIKFQISEKGIKINNDFYKFKEIESFSINNFYLVLKFKKTFTPDIRIPIKDKEIKEDLKKHLKYKKTDPSILDILAERLGF